MTDSLDKEALEKALTIFCEPEYEYLGTEKRVTLAIETYLKRSALPVGEEEKVGQALVAKWLKPTLGYADWPQEWHVMAEDIITAALQWRPIETAPKGKPIIASIYHGGVYHTVIACWAPGSKGWIDRDCESSVGWIEGVSKPAYGAMTTCLCPWCGNPFEPKEKGGHKKRFCKTTCKHAFESAARRWALAAVEMGLDHRRHVETHPCRRARQDRRQGGCIGGREQRYRLDRSHVQPGMGMHQSLAGLRWLLCRSLGPARRRRSLGCREAAARVRRQTLGRAASLEREGRKRGPAPAPRSPGAHTRRRWRSTGKRLRSTAATSPRP